MSARVQKTVPNQAAWADATIQDTITAGADVRPRVRVAVFGLAQRFHRLLEIVIRHARHNPYRFELAHSRGPGEFDLALVDMTAKGGAEVARTLKRIARSRPVVTVGRRSDPSRPCDDLLHDQFTLDLLGVLNKAVDRDPGAAPSTAVRSADVTMRAMPTPASPEQVSGPSAPTVQQRVALPSRPKSTAGRKSASNGPALPPTSRDVRSRPAPAVPALRPDDARSTAAAHAVSATTSAGGDRPRVLVVDDSPTVRSQLSVALRQMGLDSDAVDRADAALALLRQHRYELAFVDVNMDGMDGFKLTRMLKRGPSAKAFPVVILTSRSSPFDLARGALAGCNSYLVKPVSMRSLRDTVVRHLRHLLSEPAGTVQGSLKPA